MPKTVILGAARTPFGKLGGGLSTLDATDLGGTAIAAALERAEVKPDQVQHVVFGQVLQAGQGQIPSRQAQIKAGIPKEVSSETVNKVCASGIRSAGTANTAVCPSRSRTTWTERPRTKTTSPAAAPASSCGGCASDQDATRRPLRKSYTRSRRPASTAAREPVRTSLRCAQENAWRDDRSSGIRR